MYECMCVCVYGWMDGWMDEWMDGWMNICMHGTRGLVVVHWVRDQ